MNLPLLYLNIPVVILVLLADAWVALRMYRMSALERRVVYGGLYNQKYFYVWCCTFLLSCFGCISSFVLYLTLEPPDVFSIFLFVCLNTCYTALGFGLVHENKQLVVQCLDIIIAIFLALFVYTVLVFRVESGTPNAALLVGTHFCNAVAILHVLVMERMIWYGGWVVRMQENYIEDFI
jgi:hypothetical protein